MPSRPSSPNSATRTRTRNSPSSRTRTNACACIGRGSSGGPPSFASCNRPIIGLEEPELGLHPDLLPEIADLLVDASTRTQLIVTTHSDAIIDALSDRFECVVVFDKHEDRTTFERLDRL